MRLKKFLAPIAARLIQWYDARPFLFFLGSLCVCIFIGILAVETLGAAVESAWWIVTLLLFPVGIILALVYGVIGCFLGLEYIRIVIGFGQIFPKIAEYENYVIWQLRKL
ncbi:hypothetical protein [Roseovarius sp. EL26]|uniref:hypothetical protein n=1 Tax=Roseovarius sp. EL26 TaxID=2126672 RepID=UPI000EA06538|nr:hypothetical protein [Roseovarius sp. EL26]